MSFRAPGIDGGCVRAKEPYVFSRGSMSPAVSTWTMWSKSPLRQRCPMVHPTACSDSFEPSTATMR